MGTDRLAIRDVSVICQFGGMPGSALDLSRRGPDALWGLLEQLAAASADALRNLVWMQSSDGQRNTNRPTPIERPGARPEAEKTVGTSMSIEEADEWLGWNNKSE